MERSAGTAAGRIKFENPPINELAIALFHLPITEMKAQHMGLYWNRIRDKYHDCVQQQPIIANLSDAFPETPGEVFPLPRFWFSSSAHPTLIQIQRNAFILNWRRGTTSEYPHYETVVKEFWQEFDRYKSFVQDLGGKSLEIIQRCELTYVNLITQSDVFSSPDQLKNILPPIASLSDIQTDNRKMAGLNATITYRVDATLLIDMAVRLGHKPDTKEPVAIIELKAHGVPSDLSLEGTRAWYDLAHEATYKMFLDATNEEVQKLIWKPR